MIHALFLAALLPAAPVAPAHAAIEARLRSGQVALAESELRTIVARAPRDAAAGTLLAIALARQGRTADASGALQAALENAGLAVPDVAQVLAMVSSLRKDVVGTPA